MSFGRKLRRQLEKPQRRQQADQERREQTLANQALAEIARRKAAGEVFCEHEVESRIYASTAEVNTDTRLPLVCDQCGRERLIIQLIPTEEVA